MYSPPPQSRKTGYATENDTLRITLSFVNNILMTCSSLKEIDGVMKDKVSQAEILILEIK